MATVYIVCERGWEYDDNNYYSNDDSGHPTKAFRTREKAQEELDRMYLKTFKNNFSDLRYYADGYIPFDEDAAEELGTFQRLFDCTLSEWWGSNCEDVFIVKPSEEDWQELSNLCTIGWYSIAEVEIEE